MSNNKFGLSRRIIEQTKREIRQRCGFGCVICGHAIVEYHHLNPGFANVREHVAEEIVLLCPNHHTLANKRISDAEIRNIARNPMALQMGFAHDEWHLSSEPDIIIGTVKFIKSSVLINSHGAPLFWVEAPESRFGPIRISSVINDITGKEVVYINRNEIFIKSNLYDVSTKGSKTTIRRKRGEIIFEFEITDSQIKINRWHSISYGTHIYAHHKTGLYINTMMSEITLHNQILDGLNGIKICSRPYFNLPQQFIEDQGKKIEIFNAEGEVVGHRLRDGKILNSHGQWIGISEEDKVFDLWPDKENEINWKRNLIGILVDMEGQHRLVIPSMLGGEKPVFRHSTNRFIKNDTQYSDNSAMINDEHFGATFLDIGSMRNGAIAIPRDGWDGKLHSGALIWAGEEM